MSRCMICGRRVSDEDVACCDKCLKGYWLGPQEPNGVCSRCSGTKVYVHGGREYQCEFCN